MVRAGLFLAESGIRQFLDIGTGIPTRPNLHEVVQAIRPDADIVYVDNDLLVMTDVRALLIPEGDATGCLALAISAVVHDSAPEDVARFVDAARAGGLEMHSRTRSGVEAFFAGLDLVPPGVVPVHHWRRDSEETLADDKPVGIYGGMAIKP